MHKEQRSVGQQYLYSSVPGLSAFARPVRSKGVWSPKL